MGLPKKVKKDIKLTSSKTLMDRREELVDKIKEKIQTSKVESED